MHRDEARGDREAPAGVRVASSEDRQTASAGKGRREANDASATTSRPLHHQGGEDQSGALPEKEWLKLQDVEHL